MISAHVKLDFKSLHAFEKAIENGLNSGESNPVSKCLRQWAVRYRSFAQQRFNRFSRGGGNWAALSSQTIKNRKGPAKHRRRNDGGRDRRFKKNRVVSILRNTNTLFTALDPVFTGKAGALEQSIPYGIRVGFGGNTRHPTGGKATIADIASFHQTGAGRLPKREILVEPTGQILAAMAGDMLRALKKLETEK